MHHCGMQEAYCGKQPTYMPSVVVSRVITEELVSIAFGRIFYAVGDFAFSCQSFVVKPSLIFCLSVQRSLRVVVPRSCFLYGSFDGTISFVFGIIRRFCVFKLASCRRLVDWQDQ